MNLFLTIIFFVLFVIVSIWIAGNPWVIALAFAVMGSIVAVYIFWRLSKALAQIVVGQKANAYNT